MSCGVVVKLLVGDADHRVGGLSGFRVEERWPRKNHDSVAFMTLLGSTLWVREIEAREDAMARKVVLLIAVCLIVVVQGWANTLTVTTVEAGDVIVLGEIWKTRLTGIRAPDPSGPVGYRALDFTKRHVEGAVVKVFTWTKDNTAAGIVRDEHGLPRATILFGRGWRSDLAECLLSRGLARIDEKTLTDDCDHYRKIQAEAQNRGVGLWASQ